MNTTRITTALLAILTFCSMNNLSVAQADERLLEITRLYAQGNHKDALIKGRKYRESLLKTLPKDHPAIGQAALITGAAASVSGEHEDAVTLLEEGLRITGQMVEGVVTADTVNFSLHLANSFEALKRTDDSLNLLDSLVDRTRKELAKEGIPRNLKLDQSNGPPTNMNNFMANEDSLCLLLERRGFLNLGSENWEQAEADLMEAEGILKKEHPDEQQARQVKLREGWEQAARKQGKPIRPQLVGRFSMPQTIRIEGTEEISQKEILTALRRSSVYVLASHPSADFETYLDKLRRCVELGYLANGFPDAKVEVEWKQDEDVLVATISEGKRFKSGKIVIKGAKTVSTKKLTEALIFDPDQMEEEIDRAEESYRKIIANKTISGERTKKSVMEFFPENLLEPEDEESDGQFSGLTNTTETIAEGSWQEGDWVDFRPNSLIQHELCLNAFLSSEGLLFPELELKLVPGAAPDTMDLSVELIDEGQSLRLGEIHITGNKVNTREELLSYLEIEKGMELKGDYLDQINRKLYESGRFLGWETIARRDPKEAGKMDLLIEVDEEWEAPPLSAPLNREQKAMLRFAKWINTEAGIDSDLVFSASGETELGEIDGTVALGNNGVAIGVDAVGTRFRMVAEEGEEVDIVIRHDQGAAFRASFPIFERMFFTNMEAMRTPNPNPFEHKGSVAIGMAMSTLPRNLLQMSLDPAGALYTCSSRAGGLFRFEGDLLIMDFEDGELRLDEKTGELVSYRFKSNLTAKTEKGAIARIKRETAEMAEDVANWVENKSALSLPYLAMGYVAELIQEDRLWNPETFDRKLLLEVANRSKRWEPLAVFMGDMTSHLVTAMEEAADKTDAAENENFQIPLDSELMSQQTQAGSILGAFLNYGAFEFLAESIEPGSWPDLVSREILFYMDGKPFYQNQSIETLLEDDSMGPLGSLVCATLLERIGNPACMQFIKKARSQLDEKGFEKDWKLVLKNKNGDDGFVWKMLDSIRKLNERKMEEFIPEELSEVRVFIRMLVEEAIRIEPGTGEVAMRSAMGRLWETAFRSMVEEMIDEMEESLMPKVDPALVAATVNGFPLPRSFVRLAEKLEENEEIMNQMPLIRFLWKTNGPNDQSDEDRLENLITTVLLAQTMWNQGQSATPEAAARMTNALVDHFGKDGWEQLRDLGIERQAFEFWCGTTIAANVRSQQLLQKKATEKVAREFYEKNKALFTPEEKQTRLYTLRLTAEEKEGPEFKLIREIREKIATEKDMERQIEVFKEQAKTHSDESVDDLNKNGGDHGWIRIGEEYPPDFAKEISKAPVKSISDVIEVEKFGKSYLYLVLIPEEPKPAEALPFEKLPPPNPFYVFASLDREVKRLRQQADITIFEKPAVGNLAEADSGKNPKEKLFTLADSLMSSAKTSEKKEKLSLELITRKAAEGSAFHIYLLGTCAEQGLSPESGIKVALENYEKAAEAGEMKAMLRLSELYRIGRGIKPDEEKARQWKQKAFASSKAQ